MVFCCVRRRARRQRERAVVEIVPRQCAAMENIGAASIRGDAAMWCWVAAPSPISTREHLRLRAREIPGFAYTLLLTGAFTEAMPSVYNNIDLETHTARPYGTPEALVTVTALPDIVRYLAESVLLPLEAGQSSRELRVAGETLTFGAFLRLLEDVQGVKYTTTYLDPREAAENEEAARVAGDAEKELFWSGMTLFATGVAYVPGQHDNARFSFTPETAKETLQRLFGGNK
ncbi:hypothetical protein DFH06DRAFT_1480612 [Mycena polygramma]|nr:hypothetical protein DFH06DRAFT_1480612 [Mycena polygramma]